MTNIDLIDDYLADRMNDADKVAFEERLMTDNELRHEFTFHRDIINSVKEARKTELKSLLNKIPVTSGSPTSKLGTGTKIAIGIITGAIIISGVYYFTNEEGPSSETTTEQELEVVDPIEIEQPEEQKITPAPTEESEEQVNEPIPDQPIAEQEPKETKPAEISTPNVIDFNTDDSEPEISEPDAVSEAGDFSIEELLNSSIEVITDNSKKRYKFHYRFKNEKLYLYGDFDRELYQILEFNSKEGRTIILNYNDAYYMLMEEQDKITPLRVIEDKSLVNKLDRLRK